MAIHHLSAEIKFFTVLFSKKILEFELNFILSNNNYNAGIRKSTNFWEEIC